MDDRAGRERKNELLVTGAIVLVVLGFAAINWWPGTEIKPAAKRVGDEPVVELGPGPHPDVYVYDLKTERDVRLTDYSGPDVDPAWSPDGARIAFARFSADGLHDIYVMNADGGDPVRLVGGPTDDLAPSWSPDGEEIVFMSDRSSFGDIFIADADTGRLTVKRIASSPTADEWPDWSPIGGRIAYVEERTDPEETRVFTVRTDGTDKRIVAVFDGCCVIRHLDWSPNGEHLAVTRQMEDGADVWIVPAKGGDPRQLTFGSAGDGYASWSPDGAQLVFQTNRHTGNGDDLYLIDADGGNEVQLIRNPWYDANPDWSPDGDLIAFDSIYGVDASR